MRGFLKSSGRLLRNGWFWPVVLLTLPNCAFPDWGLPNPYSFNAGSDTFTSAVMCDIPTPPDPSNGGDCAQAADLLQNALIRQAHAAVGLNQNEKKSAHSRLSGDGVNQMQRSGTHHLSRCVPGWHTRLPERPADDAATASCVQRRQRSVRG